MESNQIKQFLDQIREEMIFYFLNDKEIEEIAPFFELNTYPENTVIFKEGALGDFIGFVISGKLEVKKQTEFKGNQIILALLGKGSAVGELSLFDKHYRSATVETVEPTTMLILKHDALDALLQQYPPAGIKILKGFVRILSMRLRKLSERLTTIF
jgi:CRP/FNR family transcriptional regulator, cyclic AMP receptor protein